MYNDKDVMDSNKQCRQLISAIIELALTDALNPRHGRDCRSARAFIDDKNIMFCHYSSLLGYDPEWLAMKLKDIIQKKTLNKTIIKGKKYAIKKVA